MPEIVDTPQTLADFAPLATPTLATRLIVVHGLLEGTITVSQLLDFIVDGAPEQLDTINEIAAALNNDANLGATLTAAVAQKLDKTGGVLLGALLNAVFASSTFPNRRCAFDAVGVAEGETRKLIMPDRDVNLGAVGVLAILADQKTSGTSPQSITAGSWQTRDLNTKVSDPFGLVAISSNTFTPFSDAAVEWFVPAHRQDIFSSRLYNVTDSIVAALGQNSYASNSGLTSGVSIGFGNVVAGKTYRIEHRCQTTGNGGISNGYGTEQYTTVRLTRI